MQWRFYTEQYSPPFVACSSDGLHVANPISGEGPFRETFCSPKTGSGHTSFCELGTMAGDQLPCTLLHPCIGAHCGAHAMLPMIERVVAFRVVRDSHVAIGANLEVAHLLLVGLVGFRVAHVLKYGRLGVPGSPTASTGVILGVVLLDK